MYKNYIDKANPSLGFYDDGYCPACKAKGVRTAKLPGDGSPYICPECWEKLALIKQSPLSFPWQITQPFNGTKVSLNDVVKAVSYVQHEIDVKNLKKLKYKALVAAFLAELVE